MDYKISLTIATKNSGETIKRCLDSVFNQDYRNFEVLISDGGSKDNTLEILLRYPVRIVSREDKNWCDSIVKAYPFITGDIITNLGSDDELLPGAFKEANERFKDVNVDWVYTLVRGVGEDGGERWTMGKSSNITLEDMLVGNRIPGINTYTRKSIHEKYGFYNNNYPLAGDYELWLRLLKNGVNPVQINKVLALYHFTGHNLGMSRACMDEAEIIKKVYK